MGNEQKVLERCVAFEDSLVSAYLTEKPSYYADPRVASTKNKVDAYIDDALAQFDDEAAFGEDVYISAIANFVMFKFYVTRRPMEVTGGVIQSRKTGDSSTAYFINQGQPATLTNMNYSSNEYGKQFLTYLAQADTGAFIA